MSIEYTIDIQLTELGFPDILQLGQSPTRETTSHVPTSLPNPHKRTRLSRDDDDDVAGPASLSSKSATLVTSAQYGDSAKVSVHVGQSESTEDDSDDSEISGVYEEEEEFDEDGDCEEEATVNNDGSQSGNYTCSVCSLQLSSKFKLQDHMNLHTGARPYRCAECGKCFCQNYNYRIHLRTHAQTRVHRILCRVCQMSFASKEDLEEHLLKSHPEKEFYECDLCKRVFTSLMKCQSHVLLHKCMPGIVCEVCGRSFSNPKALARHHRRTCRRSFKCTDCTETFNKKNALLKHSFSHLGLLPYTCVRCRCHFRLAKLYRQHKCQPQLIHCVACLREFLNETDFQQHKKDTGCWGNQEPKGDEIRCLECGELFSTSEELKKHAGGSHRGF
ncbi:zinc finger protein 501 [Solea solea]|uniref:zinc finger protein 501 n=1 Tax=Solea solea TaxID=90069 RepID=UPI00272BE317|nr:zinc finger protein 501 [Solea solea]